MALLVTLQHKLLAWFALHGRDLPWRKTRDPYHILVSEVMLQQTQVDRVIPKYHAFLQAFPSLEALAEAATSEVIRLWAGLGYNRRAVNVQRAARAVLAQHNGVFPRDLDAIRALPGVGPYTAGAVACFAFEQDVAFMDTNIRRVVRRLWVGPDGSEAAQAASEAALLELAREAVPVGRGWHWNQAIMELGALICRADAPACWRCPLRDECRAYGELRAADEQLFSIDAAPKPKQRRVAERREAPYVGSNRFYRGRLIDALRGLPAGAPLGDLGPLVRPEAWGADDLPWLIKLAEGLARDGLLVLHEDEGVLRARLPG